jgi:hypothetical protein
VAFTSSHGQLSEALTAASSLPTDLSIIHRNWDACVGKRWIDNTDKADPPATDRLSRLIVTSHGEDQFAYLLSQTSGPVTISLELVFVRKGDTGALFTAFGPTPSELDDILDKALAKLHG